MKACYVPRTFSGSSQKMIDIADKICREYIAQGYDLTLRQLYYQCVARGIIPNKDTEYKRLGSIINDGRLAGLIDWNHITDRTRNLTSLSHWDTPADIIEGAARSYREDLWVGQENRVEVWVEKEALAGVVGRAARAFDCPYFSCRGYVSASEMYAAGRRFAGYAEEGQKPVILHLGDHDPSGIDMTRDLRDRLTMLMHDPYDYQQVCEYLKEQHSYRSLAEAPDWAVEEAYEQEGVDQPKIEIHRIALNMDQIRRYNPPPNPAKLTDSRCEGYIKTYGNESWELDALDPATLDALIRDQISDYLDKDLYDEHHDAQELSRSLLTKTSKNWDAVAQSLA